VCPYLAKSEHPEFTWACSLRSREGSWDKVYQTKEYTSFVKPALLNAGVMEDCGDWPRGQKCNTCGEEG